MKSGHASARMLRARVCAVIVLLAMLAGHARGSLARGDELPLPNDPPGSPAAAPPALPGPPSSESSLGAQVSPLKRSESPPDGVKRQISHDMLPATLPGRCPEPIQPWGATLVKTVDVEVSRRVQLCFAGFQLSSLVGH